MSRRSGSPPRDQADRTPQLHNRLFILGGKEATDEEFKDAFSKYGTVQDIWIVKNRQNGENKGITYVTFGKTSEAALAQEEMNGRVLPGHPKPLKVMLAADKEQGNMREDREDEKLLRIFIKVPRSTTEDVIKDYFKQFGDIDYCSVLKDHKTMESRGLAYVKYFRGYCAALAVENADPEYKAVFAKKKQKDQYESFQPMEYRSGGSGGGGGGGGGSHSRRGNYRESHREYGYGTSAAASPMDMVMQRPHDGETRLEAMASTAASQEQVYRLFDLVPGLDYCDFDRHSGIAFIQYTHPSCAAYAKEKLNGFEYPPGFRISVRYPAVDNYESGFMNFDKNGQGRYHLGGGRDFGRSGSGSAMGEVREITDTLSTLANNPNVRDNDVLQTLVQTMSKATSILQSQGLSDNGGNIRTNYCNVPLPEKQAMAPKDSEIVERLFVVSQPSPFPDNILKDAFCRFGGLIDAHFMTGRNYGYAKFTNPECAAKAIETLHAQEICGNRLKVMTADPPRHQDNDSGKRAKTQ